MPGPSPASAARDAEAVRAQALEAARWVREFAAPCYGPRGADKLFDTDEGPVVLRSAASALRETPLAEASVRPYHALAREVQVHAGDQGTGALLMAARLVIEALEGRQDGVPLAATLDGYDLARRQAQAVLAGLAAPADADPALRHVTKALPGATAVVVDGLHRLGDDLGGRIDLDRVDLQTEPRDAPAWLEGVLAAPKHGPREDRADAGVLLIEEGWRGRPRSEAVAHRITDAAALAAVQRQEDDARNAYLDRLEALGVGLVACARSMDEEVAGRAAARGLQVCTDVPSDTLDRLAAATGARRVPALDAATSDDVGRADLQRRPRRRGGVLVRGPGPSATLVLPAAGPMEQAAILDDGERLLRAAGAFLADPRAVPGGGRWQRQVAQGLRRSADAAPGKAPLGIRAAAGAFDALADDLVRSSGEDPLEESLPADAEGVSDPHAAVRLAVDAAFQTARSVLRLDGRYDKRPSSQEGLRGGTGPVGSPKGMPGDVPPLM